MKRKGSHFSKVEEEAELALEAVELTAAGEVVLTLIMILIPTNKHRAQICIMITVNSTISLSLPLFRRRTSTRR